MRVGDILKDEVKDIPGLHYPLKILADVETLYPKNQKIENSILLAQCNSIINNSQNSSNSIPRIHYSSKTINNQRNLFNSTTIIQPVRKHSICFQKNPLKNNLPLIKDNTPFQKKVSKSSKNITSFYIFEPKNTLSDYKSNINRYIITENNDDNKILEKDFDNNNKNHNNISNFSYIRNERGVTPNLKTMRIKNNNLFINYNKRKKNSANKYKLRCERKLKSFIHTIDKLNKPLFKSNNYAPNKY
jgi:hypothetical protein